MNPIILISLFLFADIVWLVIVFEINDVDEVINNFISKTGSFFLNKKREPKEENSTKMAR